MFCGNCGSKIEDGAKFCANCGTPIAVESPAPAVEQVQPAAETPVPAAEPVQPAAEMPVPAAEPVQPAAETPVPAAEPVQTAAETPVPAAEPVQPAAETPAPATEQVQPVQPAATPIEPLQPEQPVQNITPAPYVQQPVMPEAAMPFRQEAPVQQNTSRPAKKKKSKAPLIAGITAGAVLLGGGAAGYLFFHDDITRLFMGPKEYAKMIDKNYLASAEPLDPTAKRYGGYMLRSVDSVVHSFTRNAVRANAENTAQQEVSSMTENALGYAEPTWLFSALDIIPEGSTVTIDSNLDIRLGSVFAMLDNETTRSIIDTINNFTITETFGNGETDMMSFGIRNKEGKTGSVDVYAKDGGFLISFTGISDKKIYIPKEDIEAAKSRLESESADRVRLDPAEFERLKGEIINIYYSAYDNAEITYTDNTEWIQKATGGAGELTASAKGNNVHVVFSAEQVKNMMKSIMELIANDEYLTSYFTTTFNMDAEQYRKTFDPEGFTKSVNFSLVVDHIVDVHNNVLASGYSLVPDSGKGELTIKTIKNGSSESWVFAYSVKDDKNATNFEIKAVSENKTSHDGNSVFVITPDTTKDISFSLDCEYTGKDTKKFLDRDVRVGKYVIKLSDPDKFSENIGKLFGGNKKQENDSNNVALTSAETDRAQSINNESLIAELKKIAITIESTVEGDVLNTSFGISAGEIGSAAVNSRTERKIEAVTMPDTSGALKINDTEALSGIGEDALKWLKDFANGLDGGSGFISKAIDTALQNLEKDKKIRLHYAAYDNMSAYEAKNCASKVYNLLDDQIMEKTGSAGSKTVRGVIKLYFDDGKAEIIDNGGIDDLSVGENETLDSVYAEVFYDSRITSGISGVTVVLTDNKNDIPDALPTIDNFAQGVYPWNENTGFIGEFAVGVSPYLSDGEIDPNAVLGDPPDLDALNGYANLIAESISDYVGMSADVSKYLDGNATTNTIAFTSNKYTGWYEVGGYADGKSSETGGLKASFIDEIKTRLGKITDGASGMPDLHVALYFRDGKFTGVMVSESGKVYYIDSGLPSYNDYFYGDFAGWSDCDGDDKPDAGYITDYNGNVTPIGTYAVTCHGPVVAGERNNSETTGNMFWIVTALDGQSISDIAEQAGVSANDLAIYVELEGNYVYLSSAASNGEKFPLLITEHEDYEGKKAIGLYNEETEETEGLIVFDSDTTARLVDTISEMTYDLEKTEAGAIGNVISNDYHDPKWGKWSGGGKTVTIGSNWLFSDITQMYASKFYYVFANPGDDETSRLCDFDTQEQIALIRYNADNDTLVLEDPDGTKTTYTRVEDAPKYAYFDVWTIDTYAGAPETEKMVFDIGQYSTEYVENSGSFAYDIIDTTETSFKIVFDSSYFLDCTYDKASDKINGVLKFDDTDETIELTMKRTPGALG